MLWGMLGVTVLLAACLVVPPLHQFLSAEKDVIEALSTFVIAVFTVFLWRSTQRLSEESVAQAQATERAIAQSTRAATAMEEQVANGNRQLRAYLSVAAHSAIFQERTADKNLRFEAQCLLINSGSTPANRVRLRVKAQVLPHPLPDDFPQPTYDIGIGEAGGVVAPHANMILTGVVQDFLRDADVEAIKFSSAGRALYFWGQVLYDDIFNIGHELNFRYAVTWRANGSSFVTFTRDYNQMT